MNSSRIAKRPREPHALAQALFEAELRAKPVSPLRLGNPDLGPQDAYAIQEAYASIRRSRGARLVGRKIGATSKAIQDLFGIDTPDFGHLFDDMVLESGGVIRRQELIQPMVEPEVAFVLNRDLEGPGVRREDVLAATENVLACMEIIDSRIRDWDIAFVDTVADNGSSARCVLGTDRVSLDHVDLGAVEAEMLHNGVLVGKATGDAVLGHPAEAVAWLANALSDFERGLKSGELILSGSFMTAVRAEQGDEFQAIFTNLGSVSCRFA